MFRSHEDVRSLLRRIRTPHRLDQHVLGNALRRATALPSAREALREVVEHALALHDTRLLELVQRCDFGGEPTKHVATEMHLSARQFFRFRATAIEAIATEIDRTLTSCPASADVGDDELDETIVRRWHGRVPRAKSAEYLRLLRDVSIPDYRSVPGNLAAYVLRRDRGDVVEFETLSMWVSEAAIERYAGRHILRPKYYDFDQNFLLEFEDSVVHFHGVADVRPKPATR